MIAAEGETVEQEPFRVAARIPCPWCKREVYSSPAPGTPDRSDPEGRIARWAIGAHAPPPDVPAFACPGSGLVVKDPGNHAEPVICPTCRWRSTRVRRLGPRLYGRCNECWGAMLFYGPKPKEKPKKGRAKKKP